MKTINKSLIIGLFSIITGQAFGMQPPKEQSQAVLQLHKDNRSITDANQTRYQNTPCFTLNLMQPTDGYRTLSGCVNKLLKDKKIPANYGKIPEKDRHISTIVVAVPFQGKPNQQEVVNAINDLSTIIKGYKSKLKGVTYRFKSLESIGKHKFIAAHYNFKKGKLPFLESYAHIINGFLKKHPTAWMFFGYHTIPHISVLSTGTPGGKITLNISKCNAINDVALMHGGRNLYISAGYFDPTTKKMTFLKSIPI